MLISQINFKYISFEIISMGKKKPYNLALVGFGSLLAIALISVVAFNVMPVSEPVPSENVPLGFSVLMVIGIIIVAMDVRKR